MRRVLLFDSETTGLSVETDRVIEVGCCLYDLELGCPLESYASLIRAESNAAEAHNRIPVAALEYAQHGMVVWRQVMALAVQADVIAAHNAEFDRKFVRAAGVPSIADMIWVCTMDDFAWDVQSRKLVEIALGYGLGVASAHRALADVDTMARVLTRVHEMGRSLPEMFVRAARPKKRFVAMVSYDMRQRAKDARFAWDEQRREWWRLMVPDDTEALSFRTVQRD